MSPASMDQTNSMRDRRNNHGLAADRSVPLPEHLTPGEQQFRHIFALCHDGVVLTEDDRIIYANRAALKLFGANDLAQLDGCSMLAFLPHGGSTELALHITEVIDNTYAVRRKLQRMDGSLIDVEVAMTPYQESGKARCVVVVRDMAVKSRGSGKPAIPDQALRLVTDAAPALLAYVDQTLHYRFINSTSNTWYGRSPEDVIGSSLETVHGREAGGFHDCIIQALQGISVSCEHDISHAAAAGHLSAVYVPDIDETGLVRGVFYIAVDVTGHKDANHATLHHEQERRIIAEAAPVFAGRCDPSYRICSVNMAFIEKFGMASDNIVGGLLPEVLGDAAFTQIREYIDAALSGKAQEHEIKLPFKNGESHNLHVMYVPDSDDAGQISGVIVAASDLTRLRRVDESPHRREHDFKTLVENSPDAISRIDRNLRHIYVNPAFQSVMACAASEYLGKTKAELGLPQSLVTAWDDACRAALESGQEQQFDFELRKEDETLYFSARVIPELDHDGRVESVLGISYDVTERTRMEREHQQLLARERNARIQAETAAKARDEFLAIVSHELRAPLNGVQSWAHILENYVKDATSSPLAQRALHGIRLGVAQQVRLIEDLLDVTRMMSGKLRLVKHPFTLLPVIQAAVESVRELAAAKDIEISCAFQISSEQIDGDADRIQQAVWNLLSNAIKFTSQDGHVWVSAGVSSAHVEITVRDNGVGISPDFLPHLFDRFSQQDTSSTRGHSGLGLGLFLVRHLVEMHGGSVKAQSSGEGKGTTFSILLPIYTRRQTYTVLAQDSISGENFAPLPSLNGLRILLVDDQEEARESLAILLATAGAGVFPAGSSKQAFSWLESIGPDELPDILICDIAMPVEDGYAVLRKIRAWEMEKGVTPLRRIPALALTAFTQREDRIRALTAGFQMHMTKPVSPEELIVVLAMMAARS